MKPRFLSPDEQVDTISQIRNFLVENNLNLTYSEIIAEVAVYSQNSLIDKIKRQIDITYNTYPSGHTIGIEGMRDILDRETFSTSFNKMTYNDDILCIFYNNDKIRIEFIENLR